MASKLEYYSRMAEDTADGLTQSQEQWTAFLRTAGRVSKYGYCDQLMIFAQRPEATACAEYDLWNNTMRRYVKRGSKGIALIDNSGDYPRLRYVFDVADTGETENEYRGEVIGYRDNGASAGTVNSPCTSPKNSERHLAIASWMVYNGHIKQTNRNWREQNQISCTEREEAYALQIGRRKRHRHNMQYNQNRCRKNGKTADISVGRYISVKRRFSR